MGYNALVVGRNFAKIQVRVDGGMFCPGDRGSSDRRSSVREELERIRTKEEVLRGDDEEWKNMFL